MPQKLRECNIEIKNQCSGYTLDNVEFYMFSGVCEKALPHKIDPSENGSGVFTKTPHNVSGTVGVFTYDLNRSGEKHGKLAVMFSVPSDINLFCNMYAVGVFDNATTCDNDLYKKMYYNKEKKEFVRGKAQKCSLTHKSDHVTIRATMSDSCKAEIQVEVSEC